MYCRPRRITSARTHFRTGTETIPVPAWVTPQHVLRRLPSASSIPKGGEVQKVSLLSIIAALALVAPGSARSARPTVTVRVTDSRITSPRDGPAGYVDIHIASSCRSNPYRKEKSQ